MLQSKISGALVGWFIWTSIDWLIVWTANYRAEHTHTVGDRFWMHLPVDHRLLHHLPAHFALQWDIFYLFNHFCTLQDPHISTPDGISNMHFKTIVKDSVNKTLSFSKDLYACPLALFNASLHFITHTHTHRHTHTHTHYATRRFWFWICWVRCINSHNWYLPCNRV